MHSNHVQYIVSTVNANYITDDRVGDRVCGNVCVCVGKCLFLLTPAAEHVLFTEPCCVRYVLIVRPCLSLVGDTPKSEATALISRKKNTY